MEFQQIYQGINANKNDMEKHNTFTLVMHMAKGISKTMSVVTYHFKQYLKLGPLPVRMRKTLCLLGR